jgi:hypothetical protein
LRGRRDGTFDDVEAAAARLPALELMELQWHVVKVRDQAGNIVMQNGEVLWEMTETGKRAASRLQVPVRRSAMERLAQYQRERPPGP